MPCAHQQADHIKVNDRLRYTRNNIKYKAHLHFKFGLFFYFAKSADGYYLEKKGGTYIDMTACQPIGLEKKTGKNAIW